MIFEITYKILIWCGASESNRHTIEPQSIRLPFSVTPPFVAASGVEPLTRRFSVRCSTY